jgi:hypothetical protein
MKAKSHRAKLAERMVQLFRDGMFVQFRAEPSATLGNKRVTVTATFHAPAKGSLTSLKPVVKVQGSTRPGVQLQEDPSSSRTVRSFHGDLDLRQLGVKDGDATLTLETGAGIVARAAVHIFNRADFLKAQEELRQH